MFAPHVWDDPRNVLSWQWEKVGAISHRLLFADGDLYESYGTIPSGDSMTTLLQTVIQAQRIRYLSLKLTRALPNFVAGV